MVNGTGHSVRQAGRHSPSPWGRRQFISGRQAGFPGSYFPARHLLSLWGRKQFSSRQSGFPGLPCRQVSNFPFPKKEGSLAASPPSQAGAHFPPAGENSSQAGNNLSSSQAGSQVTRSGRQNPWCSVRQMVPKLSRGTALPPRWTVLIPGMSIPQITPLIGSVKGLPQKTPTLGGSLTHPTNLWHQHKGLSWLKDPLCSSPQETS